MVLNILYKLHEFFETRVVRKIKNKASSGVIFKLQSKTEFKLRKLISWWHAP